MKDIDKETRIETIIEKNLEPNNMNHNISEQNTSEQNTSDQISSEQSSGGHSTASRVLAWILIGIYAVLLGIFICFVITESRYILQMLFVLIIYPVLLYLILWLRKVFDK